MPGSQLRLVRGRSLVVVAVVAAAASLLLFPTHSAGAAAAAAPRNKGLTITPIRAFISQNAGTVKTSNISVGNFTDGPVIVDFSVKAFTVNDYSYSFQFNDAPANRVNFDIDKVSLKPNESKSIPFVITLPTDSSPGGQYYTLFATATGQTGTARQQVQAASLLYLTVNGKLIHTGGLRGSSISHFVYKSAIPFSLDIGNTGNVHYFAFINARLSGWFVGDVTSSETHLILPGTTRHFASSIKSPVWPGLYRVTYGYSTDFQPAVTRISRVVYIPPWSLAAVVIIAWIVWLIIHRHKLRIRRHSGVDD